MISVDSSTVEEIGYDPSTKELLVNFKSGGSYKYLDVPHSTFNSLITASSVGSYLHQHIKGSYTYEKIS